MRSSLQKALNFLIDGSSQHTHKPYTYACRGSWMEVVRTKGCWEQVLPLTLAHGARAVLPRRNTVCRIRNSGNRNAS